MADKREILSFHETIDERIEVSDDGPINVHDPISETVITYRILARIDGDEWSWENVGADKASVTLLSRKQVEGYLKWLRAQAAKMEGANLEYTAIPILLVPTLKAPPPPGVRAGNGRVSNGASKQRPSV